MTLLIVLRKSFECLNNFLLFILPYVNSLIPTNSDDMAYFLIFDICRIMHTYEFSELILLYSKIPNFIFTLSVFVLSIYLLEAFKYFWFILPIDSFDFWFFNNFFLLIIRVLCLLFFEQSILSRENLFRIFVDIASIFRNHLWKLLTITEVPYFASTILSCSNKTSLGRVKTASCNLLFIFSLLINTFMDFTKLEHQLTIFNIPHVNKTSIIWWHNGLKLSIIQSKGNWKLMRCLDLFLGFEEPLIDLSWTEEDHVGPWIKIESCESIFFSVANFIENGLNAKIGTNMPNFDYFISTQGNEMMSIFIES